MSYKILAVDDSATVRKFISFSLRPKGYEVILAEDGLDALEKMPQDGVDLIITDLNMPNMDGLEFIKTIRENEDYKNIPIIILSSESELSDIEKGKSVGANSYLVKPFNSSKLQYEIIKYLN